MQAPQTKSEKPLTKEEIEKKLEKFAVRLKAWRDQHGPHVPPPLSYDSRTQEFSWVSREMRRKYEKKGFKKKEVPELQAAIENKEAANGAQSAD